MVSILIFARTCMSAASRWDDFYASRPTLWSGEERCRVLSTLMHPSLEYCSNVVIDGGVLLVQCSMF